MYFLPRYLKRFSDEHPGLDLQLLTCNTQEAVELLREGSVDLAMTEGPDRVKDLESHVVAQDEIVLAVLPSHPLAKKHKVTPQDLAALPLVRREHGSGTRAVVDQALAHYGVRPRTLLEAKGVDAVKEALLQGFGAGLISRLAVEREVEMGLLVPLPIEAEGFRRSLTVLHPELELCSQAARNFIAFIKEER